MSSDPETIWDPLGENATKESSHHGLAGVTVLASQTRMVTSSDPEIIADPSGQNSLHHNGLEAAVEAPSSLRRFGQPIVAEFLTSACVCWSK